MKKTKVLILCCLVAVMFVLLMDGLSLKTQRRRETENNVIETTVSSDKAAEKRSENIVEGTQSIPENGEAWMNGLEDIDEIDDILHQTTPATSCESGEKESEALAGSLEKTTEPTENTEKPTEHSPEVTEQQKGPVVQNENSKSMDMGETDWE